MIEHTPSPGSPAPPLAALRMIDFPIRHPLTRPLALSYGLSIFIMIALSAVLLINLRGVAGGQYLGLLPFLAFMVLAIWLSRRVAHRRVHALLHGAWTDKLEETTETVMNTTRRIQPMAALHELLRQAGQAGVCNAALRICQSRFLEPLEPIAVQFEPQRLDETDTTLRHLADDSEDARDETTDQTWHAIKRNVYVKGGWIVAGAFAFNVLIYSVQSWQRGRMMWELILWSLMLLSVLLIPAGGFASRKQLLAVPGGLFYRRMRRREEVWNIHLFTRDSSVACIYQSGKRQWMIVVADKEEHATCAGTQMEIEFALRAWLSPLDPPTIDQLKELA